MLHVLIVDQDREVCEQLKYALENQCGYWVVCVHTWEAARVCASRFDAVILDLYTAGNLWAELDGDHIIPISTTPCDGLPVIVKGSRLGLSKIKLQLFVIQDALDL